MRNRLLELLLLAATFYSFGNVQAQTLSAGDIAITAYNSDGSPDDFAFVTLVDIPAATEIKFTDNGWMSSGSFRANEGTIIYTVPSGGLSAGTVINLPVSNSVNFAAGGDQILVYTGLDSSPNFIYGFNNSNSSGTWDADATSSGTSALPPGLTNGSTAIALTHIDNSQYTGSRSGTKANLLTAISDPINWTGNDTSPVTIDMTPFMVNAGANTPMVNATDTVLDFGLVNINDSSTAMTFTVSGMDLTDSITLTAPADFYISMTSGGIYSSSLKIAASSGTLSDTMVYAIFSPTLPVAYSDSISITSSGAGSAYVPVLGNGQAPNSGASDIVSSSAFDPADNIDYLAEVNSNVTASSLEVARFTIRDGGAAGNDSDALPTTLTDITFNISGSAALDRVALYMGGTELTEMAAASSVSFSGLSISALDDDVQDFSIRATFNSSQTDNAQFSFSIDSATADASGSIFAAIDAGGAGTSTAGDDNRVEVTATKLAYDMQPGSMAYVGIPLAQQPVLNVLDSLNNLDTDFTDDVTLSFGGLTVSNNVISPSAGQAVFSNFTIDQAGLNVVTATATGVASEMSDSVSVTVYVAPSVCEELFFSEYIEGSSNNKAIEIYNPGPSAVDLSNYAVHLFANGNTSAGNTENLNGMLAAKDVFVIVNANANAAIQAQADLISSVTFFNGDDALALINTASGDTADVIGEIGVDPGTAWTVGSGETREYTLVRMPSAIGTTDWSEGDDQYLVYPQDFTDSLGRHFATTCTPPSNTIVSVSPDSLGFGTVIVGAASGTMGFRVVATGLTSNVSIHPPSGFLISSVSNSNFSSNTLILNQTGGSVDDSVYVQFHPSSAVAYNDSINVSASGVGATYVQVTGNGLAVTSDSSDIVTTFGFDLDDNIDYLTSMGSNVDSTNQEVARFTLRDGGAFVDMDLLATTLTDITFAVTNFSALDRIALYDGNTELGEVASASSISFGGLNFTVADNDSMDFSLRATFSTTQTDNQQIGFEVTAATADPSGSLFAAADAGGATTSTAGDDNRIEVTASELAYSTQPSAVATEGVALSQQPVLDALDSLGNLDMDFTNDVTLSFGTFTVSNNVMTPSAGQAIFTNFTIDQAGTDAVTASANGLNSAMSDTVTVAPATPATPCQELFFSEYIEGSSSNKALEIYNPTTTAIDLSNYAVHQFSNGGTVVANTLTMAGMLASGEVYVIANGGANATILAQADTTSNVTFFNGDDAIILLNVSTGDTIDAIGVVGEDPGLNWPVGTGATSEFTLVRMPSITQGTKDWSQASNEYLVYAQNFTDSLGMHYAQSCAQPAPPTAVLTLTPDSLGFGTVNLGATSAEQSFMVSGTGLTGAVTVTPTTGFLISTISGSGYSSAPVTFQSVNGILTDTAVYVVFQPNSPSYYMDSLMVSSAGAMDEHVQVTGNGQILAGSSIISQEFFDNCGELSWTPYSAAGNATWNCEQEDGNVTNRVANINGFGGANEDWLISPALNMNAYTNEVITFSSRENFDGTQLKLLYSSNYTGIGDPNNATWDTLTTANFPDVSGNSFNYTPWTGSGSVNLSAIVGDSVYLAFYYEADGTGGGSEEWDVDSISVQGMFVSSISERKMSNISIKLYPNPVTDATILALTTADQSKVMQVSLVDVTGKVIKTTNGRVSDINESLQSSWSQITPGFYLLQIRVDGGMQTIKVIK